MKKVILILIFLLTFLPVGVVLAQEDTPYIGDVSVADDDLLFGFGSSCVPQYGNCSAGEQNLMESLSNGSISVLGYDIDTTYVMFHIRRLYGIEESLNLCIPGDVKELIQVRGRNINAFAYGANLSHLFFNYCPGNFKANLAPMSGAGGGWDIRMCCPTGYAGVTLPNTLDFFGNNYQIAVACCLIPNGSVPGGANYPHHRSGNDAQLCRDVNNNPLDYSTGNVLGDPSATPAIGANYTGVLGFEVGTDDTQGYSVADFGFTGRPSTGTRTGAPSVCDNDASNGCAVDGGGNIIAARDLETGTNLTCQKCFSIGEPIKLNSTKDAVLICDGDNTPLEQPLINGNIQDTLAYLRANAVNKPLLESCLEQGGIYIAIGCVDPSPLGILTGLIRLALGVVGGVALVQIILAGLAYQSGNEESIQKAQARIFGTIGGLAILIFSVLILRIIGVNILDVVPEGFI